MKSSKEQMITNTDWEQVLSLNLLNFTKNWLMDLEQELSMLTAMMSLTATHLSEDSKTLVLAESWENLP